MIPVSCQGCDQAIKVPDKYAGKRVKCPECQLGVEVPATKPPVTKKPEEPAPPYYGESTIFGSGLTLMGWVVIVCNAFSSVGSSNRAIRLGNDDSEIWSNGFWTFMLGVGLIVAGGIIKRLSQIVELLKRQAIKREGK